MNNSKKTIRNYTDKDEETSMKVIIFVIVSGSIIYILCKIISDIKLSIELKERERRKEKEHQEQFAKISLNERKCSNCKYAYNLKKYDGKTSVECKCNSYEMVDGFYVRGRGRGEFVWEDEHLGCKNYDHPFASFL